MWPKTYRCLNGHHSETSQSNSLTNELDQYIAPRVLCVPNFTICNKSKLSIAITVLHTQNYKNNDVKIRYILQSRPIRWPVEVNQLSNFDRLQFRITLTNTPMVLFYVFCQNKVSLRRSYYQSSLGPILGETQNSLAKSLLVGHQHKRQGKIKAF